MRSHDEESEWVARAAAPIRAMIAELAAQAPASLRPVLAHVSEHALDPGYTLKELRSALGLGGHELMVEVTRWVGISPWRLVVELRMVTTAELLRISDLEVDTIAWRVGYGEAKSLRRTFQSWCGMTPRELRRRSRRAAELAGPPRARWLSLLFWRRLWAGAMEREAVEEVLAYFERLSGLPEEGDADGEGDAFTAALAAELASMLEPWPWLEQREAARYAIQFASPCFYEELTARSRAAARRGDLKRAMELAELALDSVEATEEMVGEADPERKALAWARLARARFRAGEAAKAEQALARMAQTLAEPANGILTLSEIELPDLGRDARLTVGRLRAETLLVEADLRASQGRDARAVELAGEAMLWAQGVEAAREPAGRARLLRARLRLRVRGSAEIPPRSPLSQRGEGEATREDWTLDDVHADLEAAHELLEAAEPPAGGDVMAELFDAWARLHACRGEVEEVASAAGRLRALAAELDADDGAAASLRARWASRSWQAWVDGRRGDLSRAERGWQRARAGFAELGERARSASITAELVALAVERGRGDQASAWARELLAEASACGVARGELPALAALSRAVESGEVGAEVVEPVRRGLERLF
ncbi:MAG TPA: helix-turn-helix domain-containing protein [Thermoanaerobaculia bacterium]|jgi:AraC-like DNA-binding protein